MPLSFATMLGGTITLLGSSTNIVAAGAAQKQAPRTRAHARTRTRAECVLVSTAPIASFQHGLLDKLWLLSRHVARTAHTVRLPCIVVSYCGGEDPVKLLEVAMLKRRLGPYSPACTLRTKRQLLLTGACVCKLS
eukprot:4191669-Pleurochrysis_carterae.AAC.1